MTIILISSVIAILVYFCFTIVLVSGISRLKPGSNKEKPLETNCFEDNLVEPIYEEVFVDTVKIIDHFAESTEVWT